MTDNTSKTKIVITRKPSISWSRYAWDAPLSSQDQAFATPPPKNSNADVINTLAQMTISVSSTGTTLEGKIDEDTLEDNNIQCVVLISPASVEQCNVTKGGQLWQLLHDLLEASKYQGTEVPDDDKRLLDYHQGDCDYILSNEFQSELKTIPENNEGEWIAECHNRLSSLFRKFPNWRAQSVVSAEVDYGLKPDRIFGFTLPGTQTDFPVWTPGIHWPFLLIESKPQTAVNLVGDKWKMAVIQAFGWDQQNRVLAHLNLPDPHYFSAHAPLTFGVYYPGKEVRISMVFDDETGTKLYVRLPDLDLTLRAATILRIFAVIKRYSNKVQDDIMKAYDLGNWANRRPKSFRQNVNPLNVNANNNNSPTSKSEQSSQDVDSEAEPDALEHDKVLTLYNNHRTRINLITHGLQQFVTKTTHVDLGKREYIILTHLRALSCVPRLLRKPVFCGEKVTLTMSYCGGVHPLYFTSQSELRMFMKALLTALAQVHQHKIVHNDIKEANIFWDSTTKRVCLIDFGCATTINGTTEAHTIGYCAPDPLKTPASDVYSAGIVFINLTLNVVIRSTQQALELSNCTNLAEAMRWKDKYQATSFSPATLCCEKSLDLARKMITRSARERITIEAALQHQFFNSKPPSSPFRDGKGSVKLAHSSTNVNVLA